MPKFASKEIKTTIDAVRKGALLAREMRKKANISPLLKADNSPVTAADFAVQALIASILEKQFPNDPLVAEENSAFLRTEEGNATLNTVKKFVRRKAKKAVRRKILEWIDRGTAQPAKRFWTLDPIDGTKGYIRGDHYAVALALIEDGEVSVAALGCPILKDAKGTDKKGLGSIILAVKGKGCWYGPLIKKKDWKPLKVSSRSDTEEAVLLRSIEENQVMGPYADKLVQTLGTLQPAIWMDSLAKYAVIASGAGDILCRIPVSGKPGDGEHIWDQASGALVIEEAGGKVTDLDGNSLDFTAGKRLVRNRGILATNGHFHKKVLEAVREIHAQIKK
ncbi:MAG: 3'(2'),5'-bisphosphate nucleotidase [Candidatus Omnitrophica bacterium]|nr:3'(2'),5'-bisphosphate nucleotidase [Candidatus Omnitrophota bacterium]